MLEKHFPGFLRSSEDSFFEFEESVGFHKTYIHEEKDESEISGDNEEEDSSGEDAGETIVGDKQHLQNVGT